MSNSNKRFASSISVILLLTLTNISHNVFCQPKIFPWNWRKPPLQSAQNYQEIIIPQDDFLWPEESEVVLASCSPEQEGFLETPVATEPAATTLIAEPNNPETTQAAIDQTQTNSESTTLAIATPVPQLPDYPGQIKNLKQLAVIAAILLLI